MWRAVFADISKEAIGLGFLALALFYYSQDGAGPSFSATGSPVSVAHADSMMRKRSVDNCLVAARGYEAAAIDLATDSARAAKLKVKAADALVCAMRVRGHGNILLLDSTLDTPSNKRFWGEHGTVALRLIREARAADHALARDAAAAVIEMDAFMYSSSSKGILRQAVTGAGNEYQRLANGIIARHPSFDSGRPSPCLMIAWQRTRAGEPTRLCHAVTAANVCIRARCRCMPCTALNPPRCFVLLTERARIQPTSHTACGPSRTLEQALATATWAASTQWRHGRLAIARRRWRRCAPPSRSRSARVATTTMHASR